MIWNSLKIPNELIRFIMARLVRLARLVKLVSTVLNSVSDKEGMSGIRDWDCLAASPDFPHHPVFCIPTISACRAAVVFSLHYNCTLVYFQDLGFVYLD